VQLRPTRELHRTNPVLRRPLARVRARTGAFACSSRNQAWRPHEPFCSPARARRPSCRVHQCEPRLPPPSGASGSPAAGLRDSAAPTPSVAGPDSPRAIGLAEPLASTLESSTGSAGRKRDRAGTVCCPISAIRSRTIPWGWRTRCETMLVSSRNWNDSMLDSLILDRGRCHPRAEASRRRSAVPRRAAAALQASREAPASS
jgi:hypothetical protein